MPVVSSRTWTRGMKFGKRIENTAKPEWQLYYLDYSYLKNLLKENKNALSAGKTSKEEAERKFTAAIEKEIIKINDFFLRMAEEVHSRLSNFRSVMSRGLVCTPVSLPSCLQATRHATLSMAALPPRPLSYVPRSRGIVV